MKMNSKLILLGIEEKTSSKGNVYTVGLFQEGTQTLNAMIRMDNIPADLKMYEPYYVEFDYHPVYKRLDVTNIKKV